MTVNMSLFGVDPLERASGERGKASFSIDALLSVGKPTAKSATAAEKIIVPSSSNPSQISLNKSSRATAVTANSTASPADLVNEGKQPANPFFINFPINPQLLGIHQSSLMEPIYRTDAANNPQMPIASSQPLFPPSHPWTTWAVLNSSTFRAAAAAALTGGYLPGVLQTSQQLEQQQISDSWGKKSTYRYAS